MTPDDLEDYHDEVEKIEKKLVAIAIQHSPEEFIHACIRILAINLVVHEKNPQVMEEKFQRFFHSIRQHFINLSEE